MIEFLARGIVTTVQVTLGAFAVAVVLGALVTTARRSGAKAVRMVGGVYVAVFRGVPPVAWLLMAYYGFGGVVSLPPLGAAVVALGLIGAAYMAEIYRAALEAVPQGQVDAADALALSRWDKYRLVMLPNTAALLAASTASYAISLLKDSALASLLSVAELTFRANQYRQALGQPIQVFAVAAAFYIILSVLVAVPARHVEQRILEGR
ncbi:amino acid ABC transporter permease [Streptomyces albiflaviniger]|nr:amino acid ABC transporter permease [Streptomyces albiflaviniger]